MRGTARTAQQNMACVAVAFVLLLSEPTHFQTRLTDMRNRHMRAVAIALVARRQRGRVLRSPRRGPVRQPRLRPDRRPLDGSGAQRRLLVMRLARSRGPRLPLHRRRVGSTADSVVVGRGGVSSLAVLLGRQWLLLRLVIQVPRDGLQGENITVNVSAREPEFVKILENETNSNEENLQVSRSLGSFIPPRKPNNTKRGTSTHTLACQHRLVTEAKKNEQTTTRQERRNTLKLQKHVMREDSQTTWRKHLLLDKYI